MSEPAKSRPVRRRMVGVHAALFVALSPLAAGGQTAVVLQAGAHAIPLVTHARPMLLGDAMTEAYLTQPTLLGSAAIGRALHARVAVSLEALTLERGELGAGNYGEGYVDRRHPHTYLHELVVTAQSAAGPATGSLTLGRGFAPFGTDDPMMRPFVKFPVNHHLAQVLERTIAIAGVRLGPAILEASLFAGNEPLDAKDVGRLDRFADSWAARLTVLPVNGLEVQASHAWVVSPELPSGGGSDQRKWSASARYQRTHRAGSVYVLTEWAHTQESERGRAGGESGSVLIEAAFARAGWTPALRLEVSDRIESERSGDPFRTPWPHTDSHMIGTTQWTIAAARLQKDARVRGLRIAPFVEASRAAVRSGANDLFEPDLFYGDTKIWTFNVGARLGIGWHPARMGRYGVAVSTAAHQEHTH